MTGNIHVGIWIEANSEGGGCRGLHDGLKGVLEVCEPYDGIQDESRCFAAHDEF